MIIVVPNTPEEFYLDYVSKQMEVLGAPKIRAIWSDEYELWFAAEGSHRIAAAHRAGIVPVIVDITGEDATVQKNEEDTAMTAEELKDWLVSDVMNAPRYYFED